MKREKNIYYVIDKRTDEYKNVEKYGKHVIDFMSVKHMLYIMSMSICISSDSKSHLYAWRTKPSLVKRAIGKKKELFLQHGVTALKQVHQLFGKRVQVQWNTLSQQAGLSRKLQLTSLAIMKRLRLSRALHVGMFLRISKAIRKSLFFLCLLGVLGLKKSAIINSLSVIIIRSIHLFFKVHVLTKFLKIQILALFLYPS